MRKRELVEQLLWGEAANIRGLLTGPRASRLAGGSVAIRGGAICCASTVYDWPLFHRAMGFGILGEATSASLDRIVSFYTALGTKTRIEVCEGITPKATMRLLAKAGFSQGPGEHHVHVLQTPSGPAGGVRAVTPASEIEVIAVGPRAYKRFGDLVRDGFEAKGAIGTFFSVASAEGLRLAPRGRFTALIARVDGNDAGTGLLSIVGSVAGLYSGSVLPGYRGRGIQGALIDERVRRGLARGKRIFTSQTDGDNASAHNLRDAGFRVLYATTYWTRDPQ